MRLLPPLTQSLAGIAPKRTKLVAPVVEQVAQRLVQEQSTTSKPIRVPTLLSQANRSAGRDGVRTTAKKAATPGRLSVPAACRECGVALEDRSRMHCDDCLPTYNKEAHATAFSEAGRLKMAELRASGRDPSRGGEAKRKRGQKNSQHMQEQAAWEAEHGLDANPEVFRRKILPLLQGVSLGVPALGKRNLYALNGGGHFVTASQPIHTADGLKSIDPEATAAEVPGLQVGRLTTGDRLLRVARAAGDGVEPHELVSVRSLVGRAADPTTSLYNLQVDGDGTYAAATMLARFK